LTGRTGGWRASQQVKCCAGALARRRLAISPNPSSGRDASASSTRRLSASLAIAVPCALKAAPQHGKIRPTFFLPIFYSGKTSLFPLQRLFPYPPPRHRALKSSQLPTRTYLRGTWAFYHGRFICMCLFDFVDLVYSQKKSPPTAFISRRPPLHHLDG